MKNIYVIFAFAFLVFISCEKNSDDPINNNYIDTVRVALGPGYLSDIYYKLDSGVVAEVPRANWDLAFHTNNYSSTILVNAGAGAVLYAYPAGDTASWNSVDTSGLNNWKILYNSDTVWTLGAFERNATGHPDYGWGVYSMSSHDIIGDSIFVIKPVTGNYKKIWIKRKMAAQNKIIIKYANLDNSAAQEVTIDCSPYTAKHFVYYSFTDNAIKDREPEKQKWDIVFTRYYVMVQYGPALMPYPVVGVLSNTMRTVTMGNYSYSGIRVAQLNGVDVNLNDYSQANFTTSISTIGSDWKIFNGTAYTVNSDVSYFIKREDNKVFKLVFTHFDGPNTGNIEFLKTTIK